MAKAAPQRATRAPVKASRTTEAADRANGSEGSVEMTFATQVRVPKAAELVARALRLQIVRGELQEGDALPAEAVLMQHFGVSRPTLREAFRVLESERLITVHRGAHGGARVHVPTGDVAARYAALVLEHRGTTLADVYQARTVIEPACARMLAQRRTAAQLKLLRAALEQERDALGGVELRPGAGQFHRLIVELSGNQTLFVLWGMVEHILGLATAARLGSGQQGAGRQAIGKASAVHERLIGLIEKRDGAGAERLWAEHTAEAQSFILSGAGGKTVLDLLS
jgi:GntR family transcriptional regulator, transcriptional repressor for pyruvate dehydrogenase complex